MHSRVLRLCFKLGHWMLFASSSSIPSHFIDGMLRTSASWERVRQWGRSASSFFVIRTPKEQEKGFQHLPTNLQNVTPVSLWQPTGKIGTVQQCTRFGSSVPRLMQLRRLVGSLSKSYLTAGRVWYPVNCNVFNSTCSPAAPKKTSSWHWPACEVLLHNQCSK